MQQQELYSWIGKLAPLYEACCRCTGYKKSIAHLVEQIAIDTKASIHILDAGCGIGLYSLALLKKYPNASVTAFDLDPLVITHLQKNIHRHQYDTRAKVFAEDVQHVHEKFSEEEFDLMVIAGVLEYVPLEETIGNLSKLVKPGGYVLHSPLADTPWGRLVGKIYKCKTYPQDRHISAFEQQGLMLQKSMYMPRYHPTSCKEAHIFQKK